MNATFSKIRESQNPTFVILDEATHDAPVREALLDRAMGEGRRRKSSEKLRRGRIPSAGLAFAARNEEGAFIGTVRLWDIRAGRDRSSAPVPALLLGPLAVDPSAEGLGIGSALMHHAIAEAKRLGHGAILLVGDPEYYERFGFSGEKVAALAMPGPVERRRFLALELKPGHLDGAHGILSPSGRRAATEPQALRLTA